MSVLTDAPTVEFCEKAGKGLIARPFYAITNFAYPIASFYILKESRDIMAKYFALSSLYIGTVSFIYDCYPRRITQLFDLSGMYIFVALLISINLIRLSGKEFKKISYFMAPIVLASLIGTFFLKENSGNIIFGVIILLYLFLEIYLKSKQKASKVRSWWLALGLFAGSFLIWLIDFSRIFCAPFNILNGRGIFHFVTAYVIYLLYNYYDLNKEGFGLK